MIEPAGNLHLWRAGLLSSIRVADMDKLRSFSMAVDAISVVIALVLQDAVVDAAFPNRASPPAFLLVSIPLVIVSIQALRFLSAQLLSRSAIIRHLILREDSIEGAWLGQSAAGNALVIIAVRGDDIRVTGQVFDQAGEVVLTWRTLSSSYGGDELRYLYVSTLRSAKKLEEVYGYCTLQFVRNHPHAAPRAYDGYHVDASSSFKELKFRGEKIRDKALTRRLRTLEGTRDVLRELAESTSRERSE